jgi:hypothetical protein
MVSVTLSFAYEDERLSEIETDTAPIDTIKTRIQRATALPGETAWSRVTTVAGTMFQEEGFRAFYSECLSAHLARLAISDVSIVLRRGYHAKSSESGAWPGCRLCCL